MIGAVRTLREAYAFGLVAHAYAALREQHPEVPARITHQYAREGGNGLTFEQFVCETTRGHRWGYTGTAYGGDDESYHGEGRCYCVHCGADGDA